MVYVSDILFVMFQILMSAVAVAAIVSRSASTPEAHTTVIATTVTGWTQIEQHVKKVRCVPLLKQGCILLTV